MRALLIQKKTRPKPGSSVTDGKGGDPSGFGDDIRSMRGPFAVDPSINVKDRKVLQDGPCWVEQGAVPVPIAVLKPALFYRRAIHRGISK